MFDFDAKVINDLIYATIAEKYFVHLIGFEPMAVCLEGRCSIQLSYRCMWTCLGSNQGPTDYESVALTY
jgi:hypothetical protein